MPSKVSEDEVGKDVVDAQGDQVGIVSAVKHGTAHVDPEPGITDKIRTTLGWEDTDEEDYPLQEEAIDTITDDEIRLESGL
ncbi:PRC-barrel domain containing protein [Haloarcula onubensis]|uniref:PRC-barrel domain containing protein n=1 Tax=Haloarcula onubensis TaxID=2950539 RepID=A0ABU2FUZ7_9EURY|nr:PRC-barrel domain containing protein [Halomicroarcula sp. S3CR25-11]MDS0284593.1 PRC-barrel domain containing protein [Halomicroarcula sp. S3CR25-11]